MDSIYEINSQFPHYVLLDTYATNADKLALVKLK